MAASSCICKGLRDRRLCDVEPTPWVEEKGVAGIESKWKHNSERKVSHRVADDACARYALAAYVAVATALLNNASGTDVALAASADLTVGGLLRHDDS